MKKLSEEILFEGKWLRLKRTRFENTEGKEFAWESIERTRSREVVIILARLIPSNRIVFTRQYRPVIGGDVIGFPAGIIDDGSVESSALRELKEETGFTGELVSVSPPLSVNSALLNDRAYHARVDIDETLDCNREPIQQLEVSEQITVHLVERQQVRTFFERQQHQGAVIGSGAWYLFGNDIL